MVNIHKIKHFRPPWIIGHRGYPYKYPENTLAAFQAAVAAGVAMIELDVMLSRDRKLVVIHDDTLERTTNGHGAVRNYTLEELKKLDAGSWFDARFADQRLPELSEVLDLAGGLTRVNIEIKAKSYEHRHPPDAIEKQVVAMVQQKNLQEAVLISSFEIDFLVQIASRNHRAQDLLATLLDLSDPTVVVTRPPEGIFLASGSKNCHTAPGGHDACRRAQGVSLQRGHL